MNLLSKLTKAKGAVSSALFGLPAFIILPMASVCALAIGVTAAAMTSNDKLPEAVDSKAPAKALITDGSTPNNETASTKPAAKSDATTSPASSQPAPAAQPTGQQKPASSPKQPVAAASVQPSSPAPPLKGYVPPAWVQPTPTTPITARSITLSSGSSGCVHSSHYTTYSYSIELNYGLGLIPPLTWDYQIIGPPSDHSPSLPASPLQDYKISNGASQISDTMPLHYGFGALTFADYQIRMRWGDVTSNWVTVPKNSSCHY